VISAPELVALMPSTPWNTNGVNRIDPNMPKAVRKPTIMLTVNVEFLNRCSGTIGCSTRDSTKMKAASMMAAIASRPITCHDVQEWSRVIDSPIRRGTTPAANVKAPQTSMSRHEAFERT
jgi:hypothetical protein